MEKKPEKKVEILCRTYKQYEYAKVALLNLHQCNKEHEIHLQLTNYTELIYIIWQKKEIKLIKMQKQSARYCAKKTAASTLI